MDLKFRDLPEEDLERKMISFWYKFLHKKPPDFTPKPNVFKCHKEVIHKHRFEDRIDAMIRDGYKPKPDNTIATWQWSVGGKKMMIRRHNMKRIVPYTDLD